jgi:hypothetical protein
MQEESLIINEYLSCVLSFKTAPQGGLFILKQLKDVILLIFASYIKVGVFLVYKM